MSLRKQPVLNLFVWL